MSFKIWFDMFFLRLNYSSRGYFNCTMGWPGHPLATCLYKRNKLQTEHGSGIV